MGPQTGNWFKPRFPIAIGTQSVPKNTGRFFNSAKGYGFIKDLETQDSVFVHINGLIDSIKENDKVTFEVEMGQKGPNAVRVKLT